MGIKYGVARFAFVLRDEICIMSPEFPRLLFNSPTLLRFCAVGIIKKDGVSTFETPSFLILIRLICFYLLWPLTIFWPDCVTVFI